MKVLRHRNLFGILFAVLLSLPLLSVFARSAYVTVNKNAKDSWSGNYGITYKYQSNEVNSIDDLLPNNIYHSNNFVLHECFGFSGEPFSIFLLKCDFLSIVYSTFSHDEIYIEEYDSLIYNSLELYVVPSSNEVSVYFTNSNAYNCVIYNNVSNIDCGDAIFFFNRIEDIVNFKYYFDGTQNYDLINPSYTDYNEIESVSTDTLDNAFDYSINEIIKDDNLGKLNFFNWFTDMFLDNTNSKNKLYVGFINWYFNYALLISLAYILFLVLMWFIQYIRRLLERGMSFGEGKY